MKQFEKQVMIQAALKHVILQVAKLATRPCYKTSRETGNKTDRETGHKTGHGTRNGTGHKTGRETCRKQVMQQSEYVPRARA